MRKKQARRRPMRERPFGRDNLWLLRVVVELTRVLTCSQIDHDSAAAVDDRSSPAVSSATPPRCTTAPDSEVQP